MLIQYYLSLLTPFLKFVAVMTPVIFKPSSIPPIVPDPLICTDIIPPYTTVQVDPLGIVTTTLPASVMYQHSWHFYQN